MLFQAPNQAELFSHPSFDLLVVNLLPLMLNTAFPPPTISMVPAGTDCYKDCLHNVGGGVWNISEGKKNNLELSILLGSTWGQF